MTTIIITRFENTKRGYNKADTYKLPIGTDDRLTSVVSYIENCVGQLRHGNAPSGLSFSSWTGPTPRYENFKAAYALALDYDYKAFEELRERAARLGYAHVWIETENKARSQNAITVVFPFTAPITKDQYERVASCFIEELGVDGLLEANIAATHVINIHATTLTAFARGEILDAEAFKQRTKHMYQGLNARRFERPYGTGEKPPEPVEASYTLDDAGLFEYPASTADQIIARANAAIYGQK